MVSNTEPEPLPKSNTAWTPFRLSKIGKSYVFQDQWIAKATPELLLEDLTTTLVSHNGHIGSGKFEHTSRDKYRQNFQHQLSTIDSREKSGEQLPTDALLKWFDLTESMIPILVAQGSYPFPWLKKSFDQDTLLRAIANLGNQRQPGARTDADNIRLIFWTLADGASDEPPLVTRDQHRYNGTSSAHKDIDPLMQRDPYVTDVLDAIELTRELHLTHYGEKIVPARRAEFERFALRLLKASNAPEGYPKSIEPNKFAEFNKAMGIETAVPTDPVTLKDFEKHAQEVELSIKLNELGERLIRIACG